MAPFQVKKESASMPHTADPGDNPLTPESLDEAAQLLTAPGALMQLTLEEARTVARYMTARAIAADTTFIREGDAGDNGFMVKWLHAS